MKRKNLKILGSLRQKWMCYILSNKGNVYKFKFNEVNNTINKKDFDKIACNIKHICCAKNILVCLTLAEEVYVNFNTEKLINYAKLKSVKKLKIVEIIGNYVYGFESDNISVLLEYMCRTRITLNEDNHKRYNKDQMLHFQIIENNGVI